MCLNIGDRRELFVDDLLLDTARTTAREMMHRPVRREMVFTNDNPWEANGWVYYTVFQDGDIFRMYYHCMPMFNREETKHDPYFFHVCYAESRDGIHWSKPDLGICEFEGSTHNNIIVKTETMDAFHVFIDKNPACPKTERYKAVYTKLDHTDKPGDQLWCMISADGIHFKEGWLLTLDGMFDSHNTAFFDENIGLYVCYYRNLYKDKDGHHIRDIRRMTSPDFRSWTPDAPLSYTRSPYDFHMYTNGIQPYFRAPHLYVALPARYTDREKKWTPNYDRLCGAESRKWRMQFEKRFGLAVTDGILMTSRDGREFRRFNESFLRPGPESARRWVYGDGYAAYGMLATPNSLPDEDKELSIFAITGAWSGPVQLWRHTIRMDGFVSRSAGYEGGTVVTKPLTFTGNALSINFSTSASGAVRIRIEDENAVPIKGYDSGELFGDATDREVDFEAPLSALSGKSVRLVFELCDADIYSFQFQ